MATQQFMLLLALCMGMVWLLDLVSGKLRGWSFSEQMIALLLGVLAGPATTGLIDLDKIGEPKLILEHATQITLAVGLMGTALRIPPGFLSKFGDTLGVALTLGMVGMWLVGTLLAGLILGLTPVLALLLGAIITPTDPVVSSSIVSGKPAEKHLSRRVRHSISAESGFNDGLAYPLVALGILLLQGGTAWEVAQTWVWDGLVIKTVWGSAIAFALGWVAASILEKAEDAEVIEVQSLLSYSIALSLTTLALVELLGGNGILGVFIAGITFSLRSRLKDRADEENIQEALARLFTLPIFVLLGLCVPWREWVDLGWAGLLFVAGTLLLRRYPLWLVLGRMMRGLRPPEVLFAGWFGPIGVAALYYALHAEKKTGAEVLWPATTLVICASVICHGITAAPLTKRMRPNGRGS